MAAPAGALACQKNSYLQELKTRVLSCESAELNTRVNGKKEKLNVFAVRLEDTVIFPEGGGQPDDRGTIDGHGVLQAVRKGNEAIHYIPVPLDPGREVDVKVDWTRRWDHMQQHSGQHLVTAISDAHFGFKTTSWYLGDKTSFIELDTASITSDQMGELENMVNEKIKAGLSMYPTLYEGINDPALREVRTRGLPEDHVGPVRVVTIDSVESNMCCGTHVSNLAHLQAIKLLGVEKGKKGRSNLVFVAGERLLKYLGRCHENEKSLTSLLKGGPEQHKELLTKLQNCYKVAQKSATNLLRDVAVLEGQLFKSDKADTKHFFYHRREGDNEFMNILINEINNKDVIIFVTTGDDKGSGLYMIAGDDKVVDELGPKVAEIIEGKGAGKNGKFQGKANKLSKKHLAEKLILNYLSQLTS